MHNKYTKKKLDGFSLFEIIITMGILMLLSVIVFPVATQKAQQSRLESHVSRLAADIYYQQQRAKMKNLDTGLKFESGRYIIFDGTDLSSATETDIKTLPNNVRISSITFNQNNELFFPKTTFKPEIPGRLLISDGTFFYEVRINKEGLIEYEKM
ncbi:MAG: hypothetical protein PHE21_01950 [Candidatus Dojkabacteria bacterium]|nr:hypothetical protein [Candidatus Dojkabacteria bacterium]